MDRRQVRSLLRQVAGGKLSVEQALQKLRSLPFVEVESARLDTHRGLRTGSGEVVFCQGKTTDQVIAILQKFSTLGQPVFATRAGPELFAAIQSVLPRARYYQPARIIAFGRFPRPRGRRSILVTSAGTSDLPVAEEAAVTAELLGSRVERLYDVGVAGIHRLLRDLKRLHSASVIIVVAGMEGALASVVGGLVSRPVIAVPTSIGYGASFQGIAPLLTMLNACAPGIAVVNIDNGFGAGYIAHRIAHV
jgi:NCAIR mutase (PurE)-related protein